MLLRPLAFMLVFLMSVALPLKGQAEPQRQFAAWVSDLRAKHGLGPVKVNSKLEKAAEAHAQDMAKRGFFGHKGSNGSSVGKRAKKAGYRFCKIGENIALGQKTAQEAMQSWVVSQGHLRNMLLRGATEIGVARTAQNHWVMVVAGRFKTC